MENSIRLQGRGRAEKRARRAEQEQEEFKEKLMLAASQEELDGMARKIKGTDAAMQRNQLVGLMGGF